jgi:hypothetical protein
MAPLRCSNPRAADSRLTRARSQLTEAPSEVHAPAGGAVSDTEGIIAELPPHKRPVVPAEQARILLAVSFLTLVSLAVAAGLAVYDGVIVCALVFLFSVNHWRRPVYGMRRKLDIVNTIACLAYQTWRSTQGCTLIAAYLVLTYVGVVAFILRVWLVAKRGLGPVWSVVLHCFVHVLGNAGNICLYVGVRNARLFD